MTIPTLSPPVVEACRNNAFDSCAWLEHVDGRDKPGHDASETQIFLSRLPRKKTLYMFHVKQMVADEI